MASVVKTIVATGASSGLGFDAIKQLLGQSQPYKFILGARDTQGTQAAFDGLQVDAGKYNLTALPLDLSNLKGVKSFAQQTLDRLGQDKLDYLLLNAGHISGAEGPGPHGSPWCESYVVNHLSQHYLVHLLRDKLVSSKSRIIFVSSGAVRNVPDVATLDKNLKAGSGAEPTTLYCETKFTQLLGAHWWRRELNGTCTVVAVSPGLIPGTGLGRHTGMTFSMSMPDAKPVSEGASNILRAFTRDDLPEDPEQIFLTSWGEWWPKDVYEGTLDKALQEKWCLSKEEIEKEYGLAA